jgi:hypothetical protein
MSNGITRNTVEEDSRCGGGKECYHPISKPCPEATTLHKVKQVVPSHRVKGLLDVELKKDGWSLGAVNSPNIVSNPQEIVVDTPSLDEGALRCGDKVVYVRSEPD